MKKMENEFDNFDFDVDSFIKRVQAKVKAEVTIDNVNDFSIYLIEQKNCKDCKNPKLCKNSQAGYYLDYVNGTFKYSTCKKKEKTTNTNKNITNYYVAPVTLEAKLEDFYQRCESRTKVFKTVTSFLIDLKDNKEVHGLYLFGGAGKGKTYTLGMIANYLAENGIDVLIANFPKLMTQLKNLYFNDYSGFEELMDEICNAQVLLLDDVGSENLTEQLRDDAISQLLSYRVDMKLPLFISSCLPPKGLKTHFQIDKSFDGEAKSERIMSKLNSLCSAINLDDSMIKQ